MKLAKFAIVFGGLFAMTAAAVTLPDKDSVLITSNPSGAMVQWNRQTICTTPCTYKVGDYAFNVRKSSIFSKHLAQPVVLHIALDGYQAKEVTITQPWVWRSLNGQNAYNYFTITGQTFNFALDKIAAKPVVLSNADVLDLWNAGLGEGVITDKINTSATGFSLEIADLIALRNAGVSDTVIQAMMHKAQ